MKFAALGRSQILYSSILRCLDHGHEAVLIGTCPSAPEYSRKESDFESLAKKIGCVYFCNSSINRPEIRQLLKNSGSDVAISFNWLTLMKQETLDVFRYGVINAHPGDLPRYRGNACLGWAILAGETQFAITLHRMITELDAGPIFIKRYFSISDETYVGDLFHLIEKQIPEMFVELLDGLEQGKMVPQEQSKDPDLSLRVFPLLPRDGEIDWQQPACYLSRLVRSSAEPFGGAYSYLGVDKVIVWRAHAGKLPYPWMGKPGQVAEIQPQRGEVYVLTGEDVLILEELELVTGERGPAASLIKSKRTRFGMDVHGEIARLARQMKSSG